ncbi:MAG: hypothetical protein LQ342_004651 [Letrouitia transgressa]|nr:MAG: hypothetical protein LQ342_004651 [Letrouitia transgressa]
MPSTAEMLRDLFVDIHAKVESQYQYHESERVRGEHAKKLLREKEKDYPYLKKKGVEQSYSRFLEFEAKLARKRAQRPRFTAEVFWKNLLTHPLTSKEEWRSFLRFLDSDYEDLDLGLLRGNILLRLKLETANFLEMEDPPVLPEYDWISPLGGAKAVRYSTGPLLDGQSRVRVKRDGPLRRFMEIGAISWWKNDEWERTGHIMVIDLDEGRQRHPWFILCNEWTDSWGEMIVAAPTVERVDMYTPGVFPPDQHRTTIAQLVDKDGLVTRSNDPKKDPFLRRLHKDFHIDLRRVTDGKDLVRIMSWNQRAHSTIEECYADGTGRIYLEYDRDRNEYILPEPGLRRLPTGFLSK